MESSKPESKSPDSLVFRDLSRDESSGGHTISRHVGRTDRQLSDRLKRDRKIPAASTYTDIEVAREIVGKVLAANPDRIEKWAARKGRKPNLVLDYRGDGARVIGRSIRRGERTPEPCHDAVVVLKWDERAEDFYVLTSYPEAR